MKAVKKESLEKFGRRKLKVDYSLKTVFKIVITAGILASLVGCARWRCMTIRAEDCEDAECLSEVFGCRYRF